MQKIVNKIHKTGLRWLAAGLLGMAALSAHALVTVNVGAASAQPGTDVDLISTIDATPDSLFDSIFLAAYYDANALTLNSISLTIDGQPFSAAALLPYGQVNIDPTQGAYAFSFRAQIDFNTPLPPVALSGHAVLTMNFHVDSAVPVNTDQTVLTQFNSTGANADLNQVSVTTISAVPEPDSWMLTLAGLPLLVGLARRRARVQRG